MSDETRDQVAKAIEDFPYLTPRSIIDRMRSTQSMDTRVVWPRSYYEAFGEYIRTGKVLHTLNYWQRESARIRLLMEKPA